MKNKAVEPAPLSGAGTRIKDRRVRVGLRQIDLAQKVGISPAYLNLIEHNKRRIGGKLVNALADALDVDPKDLTRGAENDFISGLLSAAEALPNVKATRSRAEELSSKFPGWSDLILAQSAKIDELENRLAALSDKLTHDPYLSENLHDVLSSVTVIRSTASILTDPEGLDGARQRRFSENILEESKRLAQTSQSLADYLQQEEAEQSNAASPRDEFLLFLKKRGFSVPDLEKSPDLTKDDVLALLAPLSRAARGIGLEWMMQYQRDLAALPSQRLSASIAENEFDVPKIAHQLGVPLALLFRRLAAVQSQMDDQPFGLLVADSAGYLLHVHSLDGYVTPRTGTPCARWPVFTSQAAIQHAVTQPISFQLRSDQNFQPPAAQFKTYSIAEAVQNVSLSEKPMFRSHMLIQKSDPVEGTLAVGISCKLCPVVACEARREPSILGN